MPALTVTSAEHGDAVGALPPGYQFVGRQKLHGGMAFVRKAEHRETGQFVAVKMLHCESSPGEREARYLRDEYATLRMLSHRCVVGAHALFMNGKAPRVVMEWVDGPTLAMFYQDRRVSRGEQWDPVKHVDEFRVTVRTLLHAARALDHAHGRLIVHRDVKPANIMLPKTGNAKVIDWGLAVPMDYAPDSDTCNLAGTPSYMSAEIVRGEKATGKTDAFGLGALLYEGVTGLAPYEGDNLGTLMWRAGRAEFSPVRACNPRVPREIAEVCEQAMTKSDEERMPTATFKEHMRVWLRKLR